MPLFIIEQDPLSWVRGSDVVIVDPPRKGLDPSLLEALRNISTIERKAESSFERLDHSVVLIMLNLEAYTLTLWTVINSLQCVATSVHAQMTKMKRDHGFYVRGKLQFR